MAKPQRKELQDRSSSEKLVPFPKQQPAPKRGIYYRARIRNIMTRFIEARGIIAEQQEIIDLCHRQLKQLHLNPGQYEGATIYKVKETKVRGFTRSAYTAVRGRTIK